MQTALLPFLIPSSNLQRRLYLPYHPLRDICVSAPTGSGKTLAYVLPIIEVNYTCPVTHDRTQNDRLDAFIQNYHTITCSDRLTYQRPSQPSPGNLRSFGEGT